MFRNEKDVVVMETDDSNDGTLSSNYLLKPSRTKIYSAIVPASNRLLRVDVATPKSNFSYSGYVVDVLVPTNTTSTAA